MEVANESSADRSCVPTSQIEPMQDRMVRMMREPFNSTQAVSL